MLHLIFYRPSNSLKVFASDGTSKFIFEANGSAWGDGGPDAPYGKDCQIAPGHYKLTQVERINPPIPSEGAGQIYVEDLTPADISALAMNKRAFWDQDNPGNVLIGGRSLRIGNLAKYGRAEVMLHGGGSNLGEPACFAPMQPLCRTYGCTRLHNADLAQLMDFLEPQLASGQHVVFSVIGDSPELPQ